MQSGLTGTSDFSTAFHPDTDEPQNNSVNPQRSSRPKFSLFNGFREQMLLCEADPRILILLKSKTLNIWREIEGVFCAPVTTTDRITDNCD